MQHALNNRANKIPVFDLTGAAKHVLKLRSFSGCRISSNTNVSASSTAVGSKNLLSDYNLADGHSRIILCRKLSILMGLTGFMEYKTIFKYQQLRRRGSGVQV